MIYADVRTMKARIHNVAGGAPASATNLFRKPKQNRASSSYHPIFHPILDPIFKRAFCCKIGWKIGSKIGWKIGSKTP